MPEYKRNMIHFGSGFNKDPDQGVFFLVFYYYQAFTEDIRVSMFDVSGSLYVSEVRFSMYNDSK